MPELPEVETVRRGLAPVMESAKIARLVQNRPDLRFPLPENFPARMQGRRVEKLARRAKYLLLHLSGSEVLAVHLGMSGRMTILAPGETPPPGAPDPKHDHVVFHLESGHQVRFNDPRRFGFMLLLGEDELPGHRLFRALGPEPLGNRFHAAHLAARAKGRSTPLKSFLLDQKVVAGLGNIYVCEALWRAGLSPQRQAKTLRRANGTPTAAAENLARAVREVLHEAIKAGGSSLRDHRRADGSLGYFQHRFAVYGRDGAPCRRQGCKGEVRRIVQSGRATFFCPRCQQNAKSP